MLISWLASSLFASSILSAETNPVTVDPVTCLNTRLNLVDPMFAISSRSFCLIALPRLFSICDTTSIIERRSCSGTPPYRISSILRSLAITRFAIPGYRRPASGPRTSLGDISPSIFAISGSQEA